MPKFTSKNKIIIIAVTLILVLGAVLLGQNVIKRTPGSKSNNILSENDLPSSQPKTPSPKTTPTTSPTKISSPAIKMIAGSDSFTLNFAPNDTLYEALLKGKNSGKINFSGTNYPGLGFFITDIGTLHSGNGKYLLYYINGKEASVGVSSYTLKDGDVIEWKLE